MYRLPDRLRSALAKPLGSLLPDAEGVARAKAAPFVVAVGDVTTERLLAGGVLPRVMVVDGKTQRTGEVADLTPLLVDRMASATPVVRVANPAATITEQLWNALATALAAESGANAPSGHAVVVEVDGEEDLAALPAVLLSPAGALVCYGQPNEGMVVVEVDDAARSLVRSFLSQMEA